VALSGAIQRHVVASYEYILELSQPRNGDTVRDHRNSLTLSASCCETPDVSPMQTVTVVVVTPGQPEPPRSALEPGNIINKGLTSDAVGGVSVLCLCVTASSLSGMFACYVHTSHGKWRQHWGHNPGSLFYKVGVRSFVCFSFRCCKTGSNDRRMPSQHQFRPQ